MVSPGENEEEGSMTEILPGFKSIEEFTQSGFKAVIEATKFSSKLPSGHAWDLYNAYPSFQTIMDKEGKKLLEMMNMILGHHGIKGNIVMRDLEEKFDLLVDFNDTVLERVGSNLDEISGIRRNPVPVVVESSGSTTRVISGSWNRSNASKPSVSSKKAPLRLLTAKNIERPQIKFKDKIDNSSNPFEPRITEKPNALKPFSVLVELTENGESYSHPYEYELDLFKPPKSQLRKVVPQKFKNVNDTPLIMIKSPQDVDILLDDLKKQTEIAVDLEHHSYRSFQGFTCLMQISTREKDYIIDTLELRHKLYVLNEVFTNPKIVKVFHGASCDIEWLQRDLCLYVVNMFDTHQAARMLNFAHLSLAYLLKHYCDVLVNKQFQLADWRMRPLPEELINYAREDTHYLLYVYDVMKNALIEGAKNETNHLMAVIEQSKELCKRKYEKPIVTEDSHLELYRKNKKMFDNKQMYAFRELFRWRDKTAREEDESIGYVLPNHMLMSIAEVLPREMQGILALCSPIPPLVRQNVLKLHQIILKAREQSLIRPVMEAEARMRPIAQTIWNKIDLDSPLYCPHDMKYRQDFREDLPTVLKPSDQPIIDEKVSAKLLNSKPVISLFEDDDDDKGVNELNDSLIVRPQRSLFVSPYERYKKARPFIEAQEKEQEEQKRHNDNVSKETEKITPQNEIKECVEEEPVVPLNKQSGKWKRKKGKEDNLNSSVATTSQHTVKKQKTGQRPSSSTSSNKTSQKRHSGEELETTSNHTAKKQTTDQNPCTSTSSDNTPQKRHLEDDPPVTSKKRQKLNKTHQLQVDETGKNKPIAFQPFDYDKIDFNRFQGGSKTEQSKQQKNKGKFKPKGKKSKFIGKTNHKSMTFGTNRR